MSQGNRKIIKKRGSRSCGYGNAQKHRGAGSRGGRGMAGSNKHKWSRISKFNPGYFGRSGFKRPNPKETKAINIGYINQNMENWVKKGVAKSEKKKYLVNLTDIGYDKLLGAGKVTYPIKITVDKYSALALQKVEDAGGKIKPSSSQKSKNKE